MPNVVSCPFLNGIENLHRYRQPPHLPPHVNYSYQDVSVVSVLQYTCLNIPCLLSFAMENKVLSIADLEEAASNSLSVSARYVLTLVFAVFILNMK